MSTPKTETKINIPFILLTLKVEMTTTPNFTQTSSNT